MKQEKEYFAFISYKREDERWAKWLAHQLDNYKLPSTLNGKELPPSLRKTFRDVDELSAGNLPEQIFHALSSSDYLIVVCSPLAAKSEWVNKEIEDFIKIKGGKSDHIYPFIIDGEPFSKDPLQECFPEALRALPDDEERIGGNINEQGGRYAAVVKVIAGMLGVSFDSLWHKYEREQKKKRYKRIGMVIGVSLSFTIVSLAFSTWIWHQNVLLNEKDRKIMVNQSRAVAEKADQLLEEGDSYTAKMLLLETMTPERPYVPELEECLRKAFNYETAVLKTGSSVTSASYSSDQRLIAVSTVDGSLFVYDAPSGAIHRSFHGDFGNVHSTHFSPDCKHIVTALWDENSVRIWSIDKNCCEDSLYGHSGSVTRAKYSNDGQYIASSSKDKTIKIWDAKNKKCIRTLIGHDDYVQEIVFSSDNKRIVSASDDKTLKMWDVETGECIRTFVGHNSLVWAVDISRDGHWVASGSTDGIIKIWDVFKGQCLKSLEGHKSAIHSVQFTKDGLHLLSSSGNPSKSDDDNSVRIWDVMSGQCIKTLDGHTSQVNSASYSPDENTIISASSDKTVKIWDLNSTKDNKTSCLKTIKGHHGGVNYASFDKEGRKIVSASKDHSIRVWNINSGKCIDSLINNAGSVLCSTFSSNGQYVLASSAWGNVILWDLKNDTCYSFNHTNWLCTASFSPYDNFFVTASVDDSIRVWDTTKRKQINVWKGHDNTIYSVSFSPDSRYIVSTSGGYSNNSENVTKVWDAKTGKLHKVLKGHSGVVTCAVVNPNGKEVASSSWDGTIKIWSLEDGVLIRTLNGHTNIVESVSYSPDGKYLVSASYDKTIRIWDSTTGFLLYTISGHSDYVHSAFFSKDGNTVISASKDGTIKVWGIPSLQQLLDETKRRFSKRELTLDERRKYYLE